jgi:ribonuclease-3
LLRALNYRFQDAALVEQALTHRSVGHHNNERLEFLGDAILGCIIAEELYRRFSEASEGDLTRLRATLVKGDTLAEIGKGLALGDYIRLGSGELKSGGFRRGSILACGVEALIGAVYLDGGFAAAKKLVLDLYKERLESVSPEDELKDPKTRLQEFLQSRKLPLPRYDLIKVEGEAHSQTFYIECVAETLKEPIPGTGNSRRKAEQNAAKKVLKILVEATSRSASNG